MLRCLGPQQAWVACGQPRHLLTVQASWLLLQLQLLGVSMGRLLLQLLLRVYMGALLLQLLGRVAGVLHGGGCMQGGRGALGMAWHSRHPRSCTLHGLSRRHVGVLAAAPPCGTVCSPLPQGSLLEGSSVAQVHASGV